jgi:DNA-directed RNA polymerase subunit K/omega
MTTVASHHCKTARIWDEKTPKLPDLESLESSEEAKSITESSEEESLESSEEAKSITESSEEEFLESAASDSRATPKEKRRSFPYLTIYEKIFLIGFRTVQLQNGSVPMVSVEHLHGRKDCQRIAEEELKRKVIPFKVRRTFPNGDTEVWSLDDLIIL